MQDLHACAAFPQCGRAEQLNEFPLLGRAWSTVGGRATDSPGRQEESPGEGSRGTKDQCLAGLIRPRLGSLQEGLAASNVQAVAPGVRERFKLRWWRYCSSRALGRA